jgi:hypothetical protein
VPFGDHVGFVLQPLSGPDGTAEPALGYQPVRDLEPGHEA